MYPFILLEFRMIKISNKMKNSFQNRITNLNNGILPKRYYIFYSIRDMEQKSVVNVIFHNWHYNNVEQSFKSFIYMRSYDFWDGNQVKCIQHQGSNINTASLLEYRVRTVKFVDQIVGILQALCTTLIKLRRKN